MNLRQQSSRYGAAVLFTAGIAGALLVVAAVRSRFNLNFEMWLAVALVVSLILHARAGFALSRAQQEIELLRGLVKKLTTSSGKAPPVQAFETLEEGDKDDATVLEEVKDAIENDRIDLYLQPIVSLPQRRTRCYEAFSRLRRADGGILNPADYVDAAERANRIGVIDNMILLRAVQSLRNLGPHSANYRIFCNVSPATIFDQDFFVRFTDYLDANHDLAQRLVFEFTYPAVEMVHERVAKNLQAVADRGFSFSVDHIRRFDLNWQALRERNFRYVKVASSLLIAEMAKGDIGRARIAAFKEALADNGIDLIVEKIEQETQAAQIHDLGVDYGQGALFGAPKVASKYITPTQPANSDFTPALAAAS